MYVCVLPLHLFRRTSVRPRRPRRWIACPGAALRRSPAACRRAEVSCRSVACRGAWRPPAPAAGGPSWRELAEDSPTETRRSDTEWFVRNVWPNVRRRLIRSSYEYSPTPGWVSTAARGVRSPPTLRIVYARRRTPTVSWASPRPPPPRPPLPLRFPCPWLITVTSCKGYENNWWI